MVVSSQVGTTYTLVAGDANTSIYFTNAATQTVTVPTNASVAFQVGTRIRSTQQGAGKVTMVPTGGVTITSQSSWLSTVAQFAAIELEKYATDSWSLIGGLGV
jgi:hypothetical protein